MIDNNQQKGLSFAPSLRDRTKQFNEFVNNARQKKLIDKTNASDAQRQELFISGMDTRFDNISNDCNRAVRMGQVASGAIDYLSSLADFSDIDFGDDKWTDGAVINAYKAAFPETAGIMKNYVKDDSNTNCDPTQFYKDMGWDMTEGEDRINQALESAFSQSNLTPREFAENTWNTILEPLRITTKGIRAGTNAFENMGYDVANAIGLDSLMGRDAEAEKKNNSELNAIIQYALDKYTDNGMWWQLTDEEMDKATRELWDNPELLAQYMGTQNLANAATETTLGGTWLAASLGGFGWIPAVINGALSVGLNLPATGVPLNAVLQNTIGLIGEGIGLLFDEVPADGSLADRYWKALDDDSKELVKYFGAGKIIGSGFRRNPKTGKIEVRPTIKNISKNLGGLLTEGLDWIKSRKIIGGGDGPDGPTGGTGLTPVEEGAINEQMGLEAGRTINPKYIYENKQASDAYTQLDPEQLRNVKDFKTLIQMLRESIKGKASTQDAILDTIDKEYGMGTEYREPLEGRGEFSDIPSRTVEKWFNIMDRYTTFTRDKNILNIMNKVANKNKLTAKDMKNMARALDRQFKIWKKGKTHEEIKQGEAEIEATRQELNALIRQEVDLIQDFREIGIPNILEYLDKQQSPQIATVEKLVELNNKVNQIKTAVPNKSTLNKIGTFLGKFSSKAKAATTIIDKMGGPDYMDALLREKNLNKALNAFSDLYEKIKKSPDKADKVINEWLKEKNNKEVAEHYGGFVEGEVIEPDFNPSRSPNEFLEELLETVDVEKPENFMIGEDANYNGQGGIDYTTPTRVTPEGYPGRYGATSESYKGKPAGDFGTPAEFEPQIKSEPITAEDYAGKYGQTLESFKAQLQKAGLKTDLIDAFIGNLEKKNFKVGGKQGTLFDIPKETKPTTKASSTKKTSTQRAKETLAKAKKRKSESNPK